MLAWRSPSARSPASRRPTIPPREAVRDHLVPVDPYPGESLAKYASFLHKCLAIPENNPTLMIIMPAFKPEECIEVQEGAMSFKVIYTTLDRNAWYSMPENANDRVGSQPKMHRSASPLPAALAARINDLWNRALEGVRYDKANEFPLIGVQDATSFEFWHGNKYGCAAHSPISACPG